MTAISHQERLDQYVSQFAEQLWELGARQADPKRNQPVSDTYLDEISQKLQASFAMAKQRQEQLQKDVDSLSSDILSTRQWRQFAQVVTILQVCSWFGLIGVAVWSYFAPNTDKAAQHTNLAVKITSIVLVAIVWVAWDQYGRSRERKMEAKTFNQDFERSVDPVSQLIEQIQTFEKIANEQVNSASFDPAEDANRIAEICKAYEQLQGKYRECFPPRDKLVAILVYMLPEAHPLRAHYLHLHEQATRSAATLLDSPARKEEEEVEKEEEVEPITRIGVESWRLEEVPVLGCGGFGISPRRETMQQSFQRAAVPLLSATPLQRSQGEHSAYESPRILEPQVHERLEQLEEAFAQFKLYYGLDLSFTCGQGQIAHRFGALTEDEHNGRIMPTNSATPRSESDRQPSPSVTTLQPLHREYTLSRRDLCEIIVDS